MMDGFLIMDKSPGMTSYDVIRRLKKIHPFKKIGYIGTLDRNATGILPVALNEGVKLIPFLENGEKRYVARFVLGVTTDTLDMDGKRLSEVEPPVYDTATIAEALSRFRGRIVQKIPVYSSKKIDGKPAYKWVRQGKLIDPPNKEVEVYDIHFLGYVHPYVDVEVSCSKGTYIRVIAHDFGSILGCGAALHTLKRTQHGEFSLGKKSVAIDELATKQDILDALIPLHDVLQTTRGLTIDPVLEKFLKNGMPLPLMGGSRDWKDGELAKLLSKNGALLGIGAVDTDSKTIRMKRLINS
jgi:tRNA pseudouridine55 synthase